MKSKQSGAMLLEVLVSILIFSFGILGLVGLQVVATQNSAGAEYRTLASTLASDLVSQMWLKKTSDPSSANLSADITNWNTKVLASGLPNVTANVLRGADAVTTITITWKPPSKSSTEAANRYVTRVAVTN